MTSQSPASNIEMSNWVLQIKMTLSTVLVYVSIPFVLVTLYFGTRGGFYNTDKYDGDGTAHKVLK